LELAKSKGATIIGICNVVGSSIARVTDAGSYTHAGPEIGVASTKAFTAQVTVLILMALHLAQKRGTIAQSRLQRLLTSLQQIPALVEETLKTDALVQHIAEEYKDARNFLYLGIKNALDPLRFSVELADSRRFLSDRLDNPNIENELEVLQAYVQLHFDDVIGDAPLNLSFGRMAFDWADRRIISRNRNRNTISAFDGLRLRLGDENTPWEIDAIAVRPVDRSVENLDESSDNATLYGIAGYWRGWSPHVVLEPYWLWLDQDETRGIPIQRDLHTFGLHAFGQWGEKSTWDYDLSLAGQWGTTQGRDHRAWAAHIESGYTWSTAWKPRLAFWCNYASGDQNATDGSNERFDPLYGATYAFYGFTSYFALQNIINPSVRLSFAPAKKLKCELIHRAIWLASDTDAWVRGLRRDNTGGSGTYVGQETDVRLVWQVCKNFDIDLAYAHFFPGSFVNASGASPQSDFVQIAGTLRF
jgi:hypothetical protein